jgi:hypothetical protein
LRKNVALAGDRKPGSLDQLPAAERCEWRRFWVDVEALFKRANELALPAPTKR